MSNKHNSSIGRPNRALSLTTNQIKAQRSQEWQKERDYSSSEEENDKIGGRKVSEVNVNHFKHNTNVSPSRDSSSVLAQLIAQSQQFVSSKLMKLNIVNIKIVLLLKLKFLTVH